MCLSNDLVILGNHWNSIWKVLCFGHYFSQHVIRLMAGRSASTDRRFDYLKVTTHFVAKVRFMNAGTRLMRVIEFSRKSKSFLFFCSMKLLIFLQIEW